MNQQLKRILCIDDEASILDVAKMALEHVGGFEVATCTSGKEALDKAVDINPDMILIDVMMPGLDGPTTYAMLKNFPALKNTAFVFMTAKVQPKEVASYIGLGAVGVVMKPFDPMTLPDELQKLWKEFQNRK